MFIEEKTMRFFRAIRVFIRSEPGVSLIESTVALAVLGTIGVTFLSGLVTISKAAFATDEWATAESLARTQMESVQNADYTDNATSYTVVTIPGNDDYARYSANITAVPVNNPDDGIQKITVTVSRSDKQIFVLEGYKVDR